MHTSLRIEPIGSANTGICECCGHKSRKVWGHVRSGKTSFATYFVHWTIAHVPDFVAHFDLIMGRFGAGTTAADRWATSLEYRLLDSGPGFMVIDADVREIAKSSLVGRALKRVDVVGHPIAEDVFAVCDVVLARDKRLAELRGDYEIYAQP